MDDLEKAFQKGFEKEAEMGFRDYGAMAGGATGAAALGVPAGYAGARAGKLSQELSKYPLIYNTVGRGLEEVTGVSNLRNIGTKATKYLSEVGPGRLGAAAGLTAGAIGAVPGTGVGYLAGSGLDMTSSAVSSMLSDSEADEESNQEVSGGEPTSGEDRE